MRWAFIFGKNWMLSLAEILAYFETEKISWTFVDLSKKALVADCDIKPDQVIDGLGGTLKIVAVSKQFDFKDLYKQDFGDYVNWTISLYGSRALLTNLRRVFKNIPKDGVLSHTDIIRQKVAEVALVFGLRTCYFGETVAVSNPFDFQKRDVGRPAQRPLLSMSPSRARILVNLSGAKNSLLDPFCGIGTVGQEALLRGIKRVYLSDVDKHCAEWAKRNISWLRKEYDIRGSAIVQVCDARQLRQHYAKAGIEAIATEADLGPQLKQHVSKSDAERIIKYLKSLYWSFFASAADILKPGSRVVAVFPCINSSTGKVFMDKHIHRYRLIDPFREIPKEYKEYLKMRLMIVDEEREKGKMRITAREFAMFEFMGK